jgi:hypothetical protein
MTAGRGPTDHRPMDDPLLAIPFEDFVLAVVVLASAIALLTTAGLGRAYRSIGRGGLSLDVPCNTRDEPLDCDTGPSRIP